MSRIESVITLRQVGSLLPRFGLRYEDRALRYALRGIGVEPVVHVPNVSTGKGRVLLYDALTPVVLAAAHQSQLGGPLRDLGQPLDRYRQLGKVKVPDSEIGIERVAGYAFITSADYGFDLPRLASLLDGSPRIDELVPEDGGLLPRVLNRYQAARSAWEAGMNLFAGRPSFDGCQADDPLLRSTLQLLAGPEAADEGVEVAMAAPENLIGQRFSISEFFDGSWSPEVK